MQTPEIITKVLDELDMNGKDFAESIGTTPTQIYDLQRGRIKRISPKIADKILAVYPQFNRAWLLAGTGDMFANGDVHEPKDDTSMLIETVHTLTETNRRLTEQLTELIKYIDKV
jgi:hypothetical protein